MTALLEVDGIHVEFAMPTGVVHAVSDVSFTLDRGSILGIVGETGSGKSATVKSIIGLLDEPGRVVGGSIRFDGQELRALSFKQMRKVRGSGISMVTQNPFGALNPILPIWKQFRNVLTAHSRGRMRAAEARETTVRALDAVGLDGTAVAEVHAHELSGGMAQRVAIALATVLDPALVIADEPTTALDLITQRRILDLMRSKIAGRDKALIIVTHDIGVVAQYCSQVAVMYAGRLVEFGTVNQVLRSPLHRYTRALMASVPRPGEPLQGLGGSVPGLRTTIVGCPFAPRCTSATGECHVTAPPVVAGAPGHTAACHHPVVATGGACVSA